MVDSEMSRNFFYSLLGIETFETFENKWKSFREKVEISFTPY